MTPATTPRFPRTTGRNVSALEDGLLKEPTTIEISRQNINEVRRVDILRPHLMGCRIVILFFVLVNRLKDECADKWQHSLS
jgi:hypothetical protein